MRTLTLGVLIVSGGTLAALPFRRYSAIPDASAAPVQVTGPSHSALDLPNSQTAAINAFADAEPSGAAQRLDMLSAKLPLWAEPAPPQVSRRVDIPLSYEDLALPIDAPAAIQQRFNATAIVREQQLERERDAALVMPAMESLAVSQQLELQRAVETPVGTDAATPHAAGSLASAMSRDQASQRLPKTDPVERDRHWIRQPQ